MRHEEILGLIPRLRWGTNDSPGLCLLLLELLFWVLVICLTAALVRFRPVVLETAELRFRSIARHTRAWLITFGLAVVVLRVALLPWIPVPVPVVHDEFSYLLGADTFAHGRVTNPASPMWVHFESFHINVRPTYQSMYPPAQALSLAIGQKITGMPWAGVVLSTALMCSAIYWMLLGWLPPSWAWLGGAFAVVRFGIFSYWINSYWGGTVAAIGGALVLGALPRIRRELKAGTAVVFAAGLLILANSRPMEGFLFSIPIFIGVGLVVCARAKDHWRPTFKSLLPAIALLAVGFSWMLYYNWRGTGRPLLMPYAVNYETYHISKPFLFQKSNPIPEYHHESMRAFYVLHEFTDVLREGYEPGAFVRRNATVYYAFFLWPFMLLVAPAIYVIWRSELRLVLCSTLSVAAALLAQIWPPHGHYAAPCTGAVILMVLFSVRHFRNSNLQYGLWGARALTIVLAVWMISPVAERLRDPYNIRPRILATERAQMSVPLPSEIQRQRIQADLENRSGKHLVIVHHPWHDVPAQDWIYNDADIDHAKVIWARDMGYEQNQELLDYYPDRQVWYVDRGDVLGQIIPYRRATMLSQQALVLSGIPERISRNPKQESTTLSSAMQRASGTTQTTISR